MLKMTVHDSRERSFDLSAFLLSTFPLFQPNLRSQPLSVTLLRAAFFHDSSDSLGALPQNEHPDSAALRCVMHCASQQHTCNTSKLRVHIRSLYPASPIQTLNVDTSNLSCTFCYNIQTSSTMIQQISKSIS